MKRGIPFIEQHQKTECGLCCVAMISSYYNHEVSVKDLRRIKETGRDGTSFGNLIELMENIGFKIKSFKFPRREKESFSKIKTPAIALWESKHFVIVEKVSSKYVWVLDPELGKIRYDYNDFSDGFSEYLISVMDASNVPHVRSKENFNKIYQQILKSWKLFIPLLLFTLASYGISFVLPLCMQWGLNQITLGNNISQMNLIAYFLIFALIYFGIMLGQRCLSVNLATSIDKRLNISVIERLFKFPYKYFSTRSSGDLIYSINGLSRIRQLFTNQFITGILDAGFAICIIGYFMYINVTVSFLALVLLLISLLLLLITRQDVEQKNKSLIISQNELQNKQIEMIYSMMGIKMEGFEERTYLQWEKYFYKYLYRYKQSEIFSGLVNSLTNLISFLAPFILFFTVLFIKHSSELLGDSFAIYSLATLLFSKVNCIFDTILAYLNSKSFMFRIAEILEEETEINGNLQHDVKGDISFTNVSFSYTRDSKKVLNNINLKIKKGEKVAVVGLSGSGKTTLSKLLIGLFPATDGNIFFDNVNYNDLDKHYLRQQIGIVPQDMTLFNKTIFENIAGDNSVSREKIVEICKLVNIHDEIMEMPMGYNTLISELGMNLSGGQRQRIILARALVKKPKIILLDEATSYLDNINERDIMQKFKEWNITIIVIAHRLSTIIDSDNIFVMDHGRIVEKGTHQELMMRRGGIYRKLYQNAN